MLALTRKAGESIMLDGDIEVIVVEVRGDQVRLGIKAPQNVKILRKEIFDAVRAENKKAADVAVNLVENRFKELEMIMKKLNSPE